MNLKVQLPKKLPNIHFTIKRAAILCCAVLIGASGVVYALKVSGSSNEVIYTPYTLDTGSITTSISGSGTLTAAKTYTLTANVKGEVLSDDFEIGDSVSEGQVLYELDNSDAVEELNNTSLSLKQQQLTTQQAQTALTNLTITAPLSGLVSEVYVKVGESVNSGTKIAEIVNNEDCTLRLQFNASDIDSIKINDTAAVYLLSSGETVSGTVSKINSGAYYNSANAYVSDVEISFTNPGGITELDSAAAIVNGIAGNNEGSISFNSSATLTAKTSGEITALNIDTNDYVNQGDLLVQLENDSTVLQGESAALSLSNAEQSYKNKEEKLAEYTITAPCNGTVLSKNIQAGDTINEAGTTMAIVADLSSMKFTMSIDELDIKNVSVGQKVTVTADAVNKVYTGEITAIVLNGTTANGVTVYPVTVTLEECDELLPGMNVTAQIITQEANDTLRAPISCVSRNDMLLIDEASAKSLNAETAESIQSAEVGQIIKSDDYKGYYFLKVESGLSNSSYTAILDGAKEGLTVYAVSNASGNTNNSEPNMMNIGKDSSSGGAFSFDGGGMGGPQGGGMGGPGGMQ